jgi:Flp pilus assembly protein TadB
MQFGLPVVLFVVFLILKLTGVIAWSWLWVTSPLWIGLVLAIVFTVLGVLVVKSKVKNLKKGFRL